MSYYNATIKDVGAVTLAANAGTLNRAVGVITTESLTTAAGASQALTLTNSQVGPASVVLVTLAGGTNTAGTPVVFAVPTAGTLTITIANHHASAAFNGTFKLAFQVLN